MLVSNNCCLADALHRRNKRQRSGLRSKNGWFEVQAVADSEFDVFASTFSVSNELLTEDRTGIQKRAPGPSDTRSIKQSH